MSPPHTTGLGCGPTAQSEWQPQVGDQTETFVGHMSAVRHLDVAAGLMGYDCSVDAIYSNRGHQLVAKLQAHQISWC